MKDKLMEALCRVKAEQGLKKLPGVGGSTLAARLAEVMDNHRNLHHIPQPTGECATMSRQVRRQQQRLAGKPPRQVAWKGKTPPWISER